MTTNIIQPVNCAFVIGIPVSQREFILAQDDSNYRDLVSGGMPWPKYEREVCLPFSKLKTELSILNVTFVNASKYQDFSSIFENRNIRVVILLSHWLNDTIEFFDGMVDINRVVEGIPIGFDGDIDLCICHPKNLAKLIRERRPKCRHIKLTNVPVKPIIWFHFYKVIFHYLATRKISYIEAIELSLKAFFNER